VLIATAAARMTESPITIRRSVTAIQPITTSTGTSQTQWCTQETGDTSNPHNAVTASATGSCTRRITKTVNAITTTATKIHSDTWESRANAPRSDWLPTCAGGPIRSPANTSFVQYSVAGPGISTNASALAATKVTPDQIAAR
jgi:predicted TIM-barrel enzyme